MQFSQPLYGSMPPFCNYNVPPQYNTVCPEVIGEGDVTSWTLSDGSVRFFFTPAVKWWTSHQLSPNFWNTPVGSWYIRSISNPVQTNPYNYQNQRCEYPAPCLTDCSMDNNAFHLKLHNDACSSTTDIHYFYPSLRPYYQVILPSKESTSVQVEIPTGHYTTVCSKPCHCSQRPCTATTASHMSVTDSKCCLNVKSDKKEVHVSCECEETQSKSVVNKAVNTCNEEARRYQTRGGSQTQPCERFSGSATQVDMWIPNSPLSKQAMESSYDATKCACYNDCD